ncbi:sugar ABC transporter substrate-binding protein [Kineococcus sp. SYSU DK004]|uniref:sugar ABC transporter substrate-binding protein n=1 Tax=Kineococcus sp. SYSU DK004 TaxID=3383125 RepID=UPI003D7E1422
MDTPKTPTTPSAPARPRRRAAVALVGAALAALALTSCGGDAAGTSAAPAAPEAAGGGAGHRVAFLVPDSSLRFVGVDAPHFAVRLAQRCPACTVDVLRAGDQAEQNAQAEQALADGADALVVVAVNGEEAAPLAQAAAREDVPVVAYDRFLPDAPLDLYTSFDGGAVGTLGGQAMLDALGEDAGEGVVLWLNGDRTDNNAGLFAAGAHAVLDGRVQVLEEHYVDGWSADEARAVTERALQNLDGRRLVGVYTAYDGLAAGALKALDAAGLPPVPMTGQDAEVAALQRILAGTQTMTVYKDLPGLARTTADLVLDVLEGRPVETTGTTPGTTPDGPGAVPTVLLQPQAVDREAIASTVLADEFTTVDALCAGAASRSCVEAGITG